MNKVKTAKKQQEVAGIITDMNLIILLLMIDDTPTINYNADPITTSESFKYKSSITGKHQMQIKALSKKIQRLKKS